MSLRDCGNERFKTVRERIGKRLVTRSDDGDIVRLVTRSGDGYFPSRRFRDLEVFGDGERFDVSFAESCSV